MTFFNRDVFISLLKENHSKLIDSTKVFKQALTDARDSDYRAVIHRDSAVSLKTKVMISKFDVGSNNQLEIWVEFSVPRQEGTVVGSHIYAINLDGTFKLKETHGVIFSNENVEGVELLDPKSAPRATVPLEKEKWKTHCYYCHRKIEFNSPNGDSYSGCWCSRYWCCSEHAKHDGYEFHGDAYETDLVQCNYCKKKQG